METNLYKSRFERFINKTVEFYIFKLRLNYTNKATGNHYIDFNTYR